MPSISTSESDVLLQLESVNLVFRVDVHRAWTWRDLFAKAVSDPIGTFLAEKDRLHVARDVTFSVRRGDRIGLLGVNGAGKTSLCRCIAGMIRPQTGRVIRNGSIRSIFDTGVGIQPELTGRENAELLSEFLYPGVSDRQALVEEALAFSGLGKFVDVPFRLYSNGMQARLCLSLVTARPSDVLILDEVFDGADAFFREKAAERVLRLMDRSGAVLFVSHSEDQIRRSCNRAIVLSQGRVEFDGEVDPALEHYARIRPANAALGQDL